VINQSEKEEDLNISYRNNNIKWFNSTTRGLSKSRNLAISKASYDIALIADDDLVYVENYKDIIIENFKKYPSADILIFQVEGIGKEFKKYTLKSKELNYLNSM